MTDVSAPLVGPLQNLLVYFQRDRHYKDDKKDAALLSIRTALTETRQYIERSQGKKDFDREQELKLSQLWGEAAIKARHMSGEIALRLNDKSAYWSDTFEWQYDEVVKRKIDLQSLQNEVSDLLISR